MKPEKHVPSGAVEWYVVSDDGDSALRITPGLRLGETAGGVLALNDPDPAHQWIRFDLAAEEGPSVALVSDHVEMLSADSQPVRRHPLLRGVTLAFPGNTLYVSRDIAVRGGRGPPLRILPRAERAPESGATDASRERPLRETPPPLRAGPSAGTAASVEGAAAAADRHRAPGNADATDESDDVAGGVPAGAVDRAPVPPWEVLLDHVRDSGSEPRDGAGRSERHATGPEPPQRAGRRPSRAGSLSARSGRHAGAPGGAPLERGTSGGARSRRRRVGRRRAPRLGLAAAVLLLVAGVAAVVLRPFPPGSRPDQWVGWLGVLATEVVPERLSAAIGGPSETRVTPMPDPPPPVNDSPEAAAAAPDRLAPEGGDHDPLPEGSVIAGGRPEAGASAGTPDHSPAGADDSPAGADEWAVSRPAHSTAPGALDEPGPDDAAVAEPAPDDGRLARAEELLEQGYVTYPPGRNAVALLTSLLDDYPGHPEAMALLGDCTDVLIEAAIDARRRGLDYEARNTLEEVLGFNPDNQRALALWEQWVGAPR